jgi:hypothetical protein
MQEIEETKAQRGLFPLKLKIPQIPLEARPGDVVRYNINGQLLEGRIIEMMQRVCEMPQWSYRPQHLSPMRGEVVIECIVETTRPRIANFDTGYMEYDAETINLEQIVCIVSRDDAHRSRSFYL